MPHSDSERRATPPIKLPSPPIDSLAPEPVTMGQLRQELATRVSTVSTWRDEAAHLGHQAKDMARQHPGAAVLVCLGVGAAVGTVSALLMNRHASPQQRASKSIHDFGAALHDLVMPTADRAMRQGVDATSHGLHKAGKGLEAAADSKFLGHLRKVFA